MPTTLDAQASWLADCMAADLSERYGQAVRPEVLAAARGELAQGFRSLGRPLTVRELAEFQALLFDDLGPLAPTDQPPVEMGLRRDLRIALHWLRDYLARPALQAQERMMLERQLAYLVERFRQSLTERLGSTFSDREAVASVIATDVWNLVSRRFAALMGARLSPYLKRPFSSEEMRWLMDRASQIAADARARWDDAGPTLAGPAGQFELRPDHLHVATGRCAVQFASEVAAIQFATPQVLTSEEEELWAEQLRAQAATTEEAPE
jgi:hypothetical protein